MDKQRTDNQNRAMHLYFRLLAEALNEAGLDMRVVLKPGVEIQWTDKNVKEYLWRPFQKALLHKQSTKELDKQKDIDVIYENLTRHLTQKFGVLVEFPSIENQDYSSAPVQRQIRKAKND